VSDARIVVELRNVEADFDDYSLLSLGFRYVVMIISKVQDDTRLRLTSKEKM